MEVMHLLTPSQVQLTQASQLFITTQGTATIEGTALGDEEQTAQARPTQAIWVNARANTDIAVDPDPQWTAVHYTLDCAENDPALTDWRTRCAAEVHRLDNVTLDDTLTPQTMEPAGRVVRTHRDATKHTLWHYPTIIHPCFLLVIVRSLPTAGEDSGAQLWFCLLWCCHQSSLVPLSLCGHCRSSMAVLQTSTLTCHSQSERASGIARP